MRNISVKVGLVADLFLLLKFTVPLCLSGNIFLMKRYLNFQLVCFFVFFLNVFVAKKM
jgi:hypothetical protein